MVLNSASMAQLPRVIEVFVEFLHETGRLANPQPLVALLHKAVTDVPRLNDNPRNWGVEKIIQAQALSKGFDLHTPEGQVGFAKYFGDEVRKIANERMDDEYEEDAPVSHQPFRRETPKSRPQRPPALAAAAKSTRNAAQGRV